MLRFDARYRPYRRGPPKVVIGDGDAGPADRNVGESSSQHPHRFWHRHELVCICCMGTPCMILIADAKRLILPVRFVIDLCAHRSQSAIIRDNMTALLDAPAAIDAAMFLDRYASLIASITSSEHPKHTAELCARLQSLLGESSTPEAFACMAALHQHANQALLFRCKHSLSFAVAGFQYEAPANLWSEHCVKWVHEVDDLLLLWDAVLDCAACAVRAQLSSKRPNPSLVTQMIGMAVRMLPSVRHAALTSDRANRRWRSLCGSSNGNGEESSDERTWLAVIARLHAMMQSRQPETLGMPRALIMMQLRQVFLRHLAICCIERLPSVAEWPCAALFSQCRPACLDCRELCPIAC